MSIGIDSECGKYGHICTVKLVRDTPGQLFHLLGNLRKKDSKFKAKLDTR